MRVGISPVSEFKPYKLLLYFQTSCCFCYQFISLYVVINNNGKLVIKKKISFNGQVFWMLLYYKYIILHYIIYIIKICWIFKNPKTISIIWCFWKILGTGQDGIQKRKFWCFGQILGNRSGQELFSITQTLTLCKHQVLFSFFFCSFSCRDANILLPQVFSAVWF